MTADLVLGLCLGVSAAFTLARVYSDMGGDTSVDTAGRAWLRYFLKVFHHGDTGLVLVFLVSVLCMSGSWTPRPFVLGLVLGFGTAAAVEDGLYHAIAKFGGKP